VGPDLAKAADQFDAVYTELTGLQRELIAAARQGIEDPGQARELADRALTIVAAVGAATRVMDLNRLSYLELEVEALRARVLAPPLDEHLLFAAFRSQGRRHSFPLISEALGIAFADGSTAAAFGSRTVRELLSAPRSMGPRTATRLAEHWELDPDAGVAALEEPELVRLREGLTEASYGLPDFVSDGGHASKPAHDGRGAGRVVLNVWVDSIGPPADTPRTAAAAAVARPGWPADAVPTAEVLLEFTDTRIAPLILPEWDRLSAVQGDDERIAALRAQARDWRRTEDENDFLRGYMLDLLVEAIRSVRKAKRLVDGPESEWGSTTPLAAARNAARRCGDLLGCCTPEAVNQLLDELPAFSVATA
jgi:hypothetical protein